MKTKLLTITTITTLFLAAACVWQQRQLNASRVRLAQTEADLFAETQARSDQENRAKVLQESQARLSQQVVDLVSLVGNLRSQPVKDGYSGQPGKTHIGAGEPSDAEEGGLFGGKAMGGMLAKMMKDPAMKEMMRSQQKLMINTSYGPLFKDLSLTGERKEKLKELLLDQQMQTVERAQGLFGTNGGFDVSKISEAAKEQETESNESIKSFLGDQYPYYEDYKKTMGDRVQLEQLKQQLDGTKSALNDSQLKDLLFVIADEREKNPSVISQDPQAAGANFEKMFSGDGLEKQIQWQEEINRRVLERAGTVLSPEQLKSYGEFQTQQLDRQKFGMKMAREMFGKKAASGDPAAAKK